MNQFRRRLFPLCAFLSRIFAEFFASFEKFAVFAWSFSRSIERLADFADFARSFSPRFEKLADFADFADFRMFFEENEGADRCFSCFSIIVVQVHTWAFIMTLMTPELTLT